MTEADRHEVDIRLVGKVWIESDRGGVRSHSKRGQRDCGRRDDWRLENSGYRVQQFELPSERRRDVT